MFQGIYHGFVLPYIVHELLAHSWAYWPKRGVCNVYLLIMIFGVDD